MEKQGSQRVEIAGLGDKRQITATFAVAMTGAVLPVQILQGKLLDAIQAMHFLNPPTFGTHPTIGPMLKQP